MWKGTVVAMLRCTKGAQGLGTGRWSTEQVGTRDGRGQAVPPPHPVKKGSFRSRFSPSILSIVPHPIAQPVTQLSPARALIRDLSKRRAELLSLSQSESGRSQRLLMSLYWPWISKLSKSVGDRVLLMVARGLLSLQRGGWLRPYKPPVSHHGSFPRSYMGFSLESRLGVGSLSLGERRHKEGQSIGIEHRCETGRQQVSGWGIGVHGAQGPQWKAVYTWVFMLMQMPQGRPP